MLRRRGRRPAPRVLPEVIFSNSLISAPATNVRPLPISTAAFTDGSLLISSMALAIPSGTPGLSAFTGRLSMVMIAISLALSLLSRTRVLIVNSNHFVRRSPPGTYYGCRRHHISVLNISDVHPYFFRSSFFNTFPVAVLVKVSVNSIDRGHL